MDTTSYWRDSFKFPKFPALERSLETDVAVIGGGLTGLTTAYLLKRAGKRVVLLERDRCAAVDTGQTTAHLSYVTDKRLFKLVRHFGRDHAQAAWDAGLAAIDQIFANVREEKIECDFSWVPGYLTAPLRRRLRSGRESLRRDARLARELGFAAEYVAKTPVKRAGILFHNQAQFHPLKYLAALARAIPGDGCHSFEQANADEVEEKPLAVKVGSHRVRAGYVVLATHNPLIGKTGMLRALLFQTKLALYTSYAVRAEIPEGKIPPALIWDTADPYYYLRITRDEDGAFAILGGEDHKTGQQRDPAGCYRRLESLLRRLMPGCRVTHRWSGQVIETNDGLPLIGETAPQQFAATGFGGNGMTFGTLAAMMARDAVLGRANPWQKLFDVRRKKLRGGTWQYLAENKDYPYYLLRDWMARGARDSLDELGKGEGRIMRHDGKKVAAYRDDEGRLSLCSPVCTHLKCIVRWNPAEKTWDCPCHGSRFKPDGAVLAGPAEAPLERIARPAYKKRSKK